MKTTCSVAGCGRRVHARGWCQMHHKRWWKYGDVNRGRPSTAERLWAKVDKSNACWLWTGAAGANGYGYIGVGGKRRLVHRVAYELLLGPIPEGLTLDHLCRTPLCLRPDHLEPVPMVVNVMRGNCPPAVNARKTHCIHGHEFTVENTRITPEGYRCCRACHRAWERTHCGKGHARFDLDLEYA